MNKKMKRNYILKNKGRISLMIGLLATTLLSSCLKDTSPGALDLSKSPSLVGFQYYGFAATPLTTKLHGTASDVSLVKVTLSAASITIGSDVTLSIAADPTDAAAFVAANPGTNVLPAADYSLANGGQVTIKAGTQYATIAVNFKGNTIDLTQNYVVGLKITSANGAIVASNLNVAILTLTLQSIYEGDYSYKGFMWRDVGNGTNDPTLGGNFTGFDAPLPTISQYTVGFTELFANGAGVAGVGGTTITVDPATNKVTVACSTNATLANISTYNNHYDPATKTFYLGFAWRGGARYQIDTLTYKAPLP
jgi:hypothetical protein